MTRAAYAYETEDLTAPCVGLIALQSDETIEVDMRRLLPDTAELLVSRVPSAPDVTPETLAAMEGHLGASAALFPAAAAHPTGPAGKPDRRGWWSSPSTT